jgi:hypothetical protein
MMHTIKTQYEGGCGLFIAIPGAMGLGVVAGARTDGYIDRLFAFNLTFF